MDRTIDPVWELPQGSEAPELVPPIPQAGAEPALPALEPPRSHAASLAGRTLLVSLVLVLGLVHGSRTALGSGPPTPAASTPDVAAPPGAPEVVAPPRRDGAEAENPPARESDWRRGHFYRPPGSTATRPETELQPRIWLPRPRVGPRLARACTAEAERPGC